VEAMLAALGGTPDEWAQKTAATLAQKSPKAMKLTLAAIRNAQTLGSLEEALNVEFRLCVRLFEDGEFIEGVRALLVDKADEYVVFVKTADDITLRVGRAVPVPLGMPWAQARGRAGAEGVRQLA